MRMVNRSCSGIKAVQGEGRQGARPDDGSRVLAIDRCSLLDPIRDLVVQSLLCATK